MKPIQRAKPEGPLRPRLSIDETIAADRKWFDEHPDEDGYIREFVPGEFGKAELRKSSPASAMPLMYL